VDEEIEDGPTNSNDKYYGEVTLQTAIAKSINTVAWQLYEELTPEVGLSYLKKMNFTQITQEDYGLASALGGFTKGVSPLEMAAGFATIENDGIYRNPTCILSIRDSDGNVIYTPQILQEVVYSETAARMTTAGLEAVMEEGTGKKHKLEGMPCAGKTGTTNQNKDGWFVGFTRYYTTSVWVGCDMPKAVEELKGSTYPGTIWNTFMTQLHEGFAPMDFLPYAQLSDEFLDAQEENNRYTETDEEGNEILGDEDADGEDTSDENSADENEADGEAVPDENGVDGEDTSDENDAEGEGASDENGAEGEDTSDENNAEDEDSVDRDNAEGEDTSDENEADGETAPDDGGAAGNGAPEAESLDGETGGTNPDGAADDDSVDESGYRG
jgi:membrane peptidoglycan carboxypeptidase